MYLDARIFRVTDSRPEKFQKIKRKHEREARTLILACDNDIKECL